MNNKATLRKTLLERRLLLSKKEIASSSEWLLINFQKIYKQYYFSQYKNIAGYYPFRKEIDCLPILEYLKEKKHNVLLPALQKGSKILKFSTFSENLVKNCFAIPEVVDGEDYLPDLILAPLLAYDSFGNRVGYGGGYYDSTLNYYRTVAHKCLYVGLAYDFQEVKFIETDKGDFPLDMVVSDISNILTAKRIK